MKCKNLIIGVVTAIMLNFTSMPIATAQSNQERATKHEELLLEETNNLKKIVTTEKTKIVYKIPQNEGERQLTDLAAKFDSYEDAWIYIPKTGEWVDYGAEIKQDSCITRWADILSVRPDLKEGIHYHLHPLISKRNDLPAGYDYTITANFSGGSPPAYQDVKSWLSEWDYFKRQGINIKEFRIVDQHGCWAVDLSQSDTQMLKSEDFYFKYEALLFKHMQNYFKILKKDNKLTINAKEKIIENFSKEMSKLGLNIKYHFIKKESSDSKDKIVARAVTQVKQEGTYKKDPYAEWRKDKNLCKLLEDTNDLKKIVTTNYMRVRYKIPQHEGKEQLTELAAKFNGSEDAWAYLPKEGLWVDYGTWISSDSCTLYPNEILLACPDIKEAIHYHIHPVSRNLSWQRDYPSTALADLSGLYAPTYRDLMSFCTQFRYFKEHEMIMKEFRIVDQHGYWSIDISKCDTQAIKSDKFYDAYEALFSQHSQSYKESLEKHGKLSAEVKKKIVETFSKEASKLGVNAEYHFIKKVEF